MAKQQAAKRKMTLEDLNFDPPTDLGGALDRIEKLVASIDSGIEMLDAAKETITSLESNVSDLMASCNEANERADAALDHAVEDLERVRQWIVAGRTSDALHELTKILGEHDVGCKRFVVVAPMLPLAGAA